MDMRDARKKEGVSPRELVAVVQTLYPKYDRFIHSKVENGATYGIRLMADAQKAVNGYLGGTEKKKSDNRRKPHRIMFRLSNSDYDAFRAVMTNMGYETAQDFVSEIVTSFIKQHKLEATE